MSTNITVPDIGDFDAVEVIEVLVSQGDTVEVDQALITLESDKATMEVPSTEAGTVAQIKVSEGDKVAQGDVIVVLDAADGQSDAEEAQDSSEDEKEKETTAEDTKEIDDGDQVDEAEKSHGEEAKKNKDKARNQKKSADKSKKIGKKTGSETDKDQAKAHDYDFDVLVLGSGPGGYTAAFRAADLGLKVVLVERYPSLGGVCLNVGCIPSKALLHAAKVIDDAAAMGEHGITFAAPDIDLPKLLDWKQSVVKKLTGGLKSLAKQRKVEVVHGAGEFTGAHELSVGKKKKISFNQAIIAAGSQAVMLPDMPEDDRIVDSTGALAPGEIPESILVIGGGIIGLEMANVYAGLGSQVDVVEMTDGLIPGADRDLVKPLQKAMAKRCRNIWINTKVTGVKANKKSLTASFEGDKSPKSERYAKILVAVGRRPNGKNIGADAAGVNVSERGFIEVDKQCRTNVDHIFAIGDITGEPQLAHRASHQGKVAAEVAADEPAAFDARAIPSVVYTDPEMAWTGLTENQAKETNFQYDKGQFPWAASGRALGMGYSEGLTKILFAKDTGRVVGAGAVGPGAGELIAELTLAIEMGCDAHDIGLTVHAHPTLSETVAMAAEAAAGTLTDLYMPKK